MKEHKFRAWDNSNKVMHYGFEYIRSGTQGNGWIIFKSDKQKLENEEVFDNPYFAQQLEIMEYIGKRDCNDNEIYVQDILLHEDYPGKHFIVKWDYVKLAFKIVEHDGSFYIGFWNIMSSELEVIGNIYEPHLITKGLGI